jgi:hypothetical protein
LQSRAFSEFAYRGRIAGDASLKSGDRRPELEPTLVELKKERLALVDMVTQHR